MSDTGWDTPPALAVTDGGTGGWTDRLAALREAGVPHLDPLRWHQLDALVRRTQVAPPDVQAVLAPKLHALWSALSAPRAPGPAQPPATDPQAIRTPSPLAALTLRLEAAAQARQHADPGGVAHGGHPTDSPAVRRFRDTWAKFAAEHQVDRAVGRGPDNAGPLNSHMLVLRSLAWMRELSPDYLHRFVAYTDTLQWLEQAVPKVAAKPGPKPAAKAIAEGKPVRRKSVKK